MVYAYLRVSTDQQSLENQRCEIVRFANHHGLVVDKWVSETVSGKIKGRDRKLGLLLKRLKKGDILVVSELSRLSRTLLDIMMIVRTLLEKGVDLYSSKENCCLGDNINSKVILFAFGLAAEIERDLISQRTKEALASKKEQGVILGRRAGFCPKYVILEENSADIWEALDAGEQIGRVCERYGVSRSTMRKFMLKRRPMVSY